MIRICLWAALLAVCCATAGAEIPPAPLPPDAWSAGSLPDEGSAASELASADAKQPPAAASPELGSAPAAPCDDACCTCGERCGPFTRWQAAEPWKLPQPCFLQQLGISTGGWIQAGITGNGQNPADRSNGPVLTNDRVSEVQMNQAWLYFNRPIQNDGCGWDVGGRFDVFYGTDWRVAEVFGFGLEDRINGTDQWYGLSLPQFYLEVAYNDLSVKGGRMTGILGYEIVPAIGNFFYSHSYALCYSEPILITGLMAKYKLNDSWSFLAGFHEGWGRFEDNNGAMNFQGGLVWTSSDGRTSLAYSLDRGRNDPAGVCEQYVHSIVFKRQLTERLLYVLQNDLGALNGPENASNAQWYGINQYLLYTINAHWSAGARIEWFRDDDGVRVGGLGNFTRGWMGPGGYAGDFTELTLGVNWKPKANLTLRPEVRWDWYNGPPSASTGYPLPFDDGTSRSQFTFGADLIWTF